MCELFGVSSAEVFTANAQLQTFFQRSDRHPHGWGLACVSRHGASIEKESAQATKSAYLKGRLTQPVAGKIVLAHIRFATIGNVEYKNCHPFTGLDSTGRQWTLIHNGTIFDFAPLNRFVKTQTGDTDSERIFLYLLEQLNRAQTGGKLLFAERFALLDNIICAMAEGNKLNLLFSDGKTLYVHTNCRDTLYYKTEKQHTLFCTEPTDSEGWLHVPFGQLLAYQNGRQVRAGTAHGHEYVEDKDAVKLLYQIFSNL